MRDDYTHICIIRDCSGSMQCIASDMDGGLNTFLEEQKREDGYATISLYDFSTRSWWNHDDTCNVRKVIDFASLRDLDQITGIKSSGGTPLYDAEGTAIADTGDRLAAMPEADRPAKVIMVIITDGLENQSCKYTRQEIVNMIKRQETQYNWQFVFLGANQDAHQEGLLHGVRNTMNYGVHAQGVGNAFCSLSAGVTRARSMSQSEYAAAVQSAGFYTKEEKEQGDIDAKTTPSDDLQGSSS